MAWESVVKKLPKPTLLPQSWRRFAVKVAAKEVSKEAVVAARAAQVEKQVCSRALAGTVGKQAMWQLSVRNLRRRGLPKERAKEAE